MTCPGCGFLTEPSEGPKHPYIGASSACWSRYGELLALGQVPQAAVDTYAVQHPGVDERRARQSVAVHLISLCAALEQPTHPLQGVELIRVALLCATEYTWLEPVTPIGAFTVDHVLRGLTPMEEWTRDVWAAYAAHHAAVRTWLAACVSSR